MDGEDTQILEAESMLASAMAEFGPEHLKVADLLDTCAALLRKSKLRLLDAANMEAKARVIRSKHLISGSATVKTDQMLYDRDQIASRKLSDNEGKAETEIKEPHFPCPFCGADIAVGEAGCSGCGSWLSDYKRGKHGQKLPHSRGIGSGPSPIWVACLSGACMAGLGQIKLGQVRKGILIMVLAFLLGLVTLGFGLIILMPLAAIDAYVLALRQKRGEPVGQWDFFWSKAAS